MKNERSQDIGLETNKTSLKRMRHSKNGEERVEGRQKDER